MTDDESRVRPGYGRSSIDPATAAAARRLAASPIPGGGDRATYGR